MKFLYIKALRSSIDLIWALIEAGHDVTVIEEMECDPNIKLDIEYQTIEKYINNTKPDYIISFLFIPVVSDAAQQYGIPYISWTYDSPLVALFNESIKNDVNYAFIFDKAETEHIKALGNIKAYHMPLGINMSRVSALNVTEEDIKEYTCDISFIGRMYENNIYNDTIHLFDLQTQTELKTYLLANMHNWSKSKAWPTLSEHAIKNILSVFPNTVAPAFWSMTEFLAQSLLPRKLAEVERITMLNEIASKHKLDLYTDSNLNNLINVNCHDGVSYETTMNKIFYCSKINLNITLPSIETGIPLRIFDIMGCGGFVLSNYQEEMDELFKIGYDIEAFKNKEELFDKLNFYLTHENERLRISLNGYKSARDKHTIQHRLDEMLKIVKNV